MTIGFTGTRKGMSVAQVDQLSKLLMMFERATPESETPQFHHGGADGADSEADDIAYLDGYEIHIYPCPGVLAESVVGANGRGKFNSHDAEWREVFPPLVRNRNIVEAIDILIAAPRTDKEEQRSGTWATIRYARQAGKPVVMLSRGRS